MPDAQRTQREDVDGGTQLLLVSSMRYSRTGELDGCQDIRPSAGGCHINLTENPQTFVPGQPLHRQSRIRKSSSWLSWVQLPNRRLPVPARVRVRPPERCNDVKLFRQPFHPAPGMRQLSTALRWRQHGTIHADPAITVAAAPRNRVGPTPPDASHSGRDDPHQLAAARRGVVRNGQSMRQRLPVSAVRLCRWRCSRRGRAGGL